MKWKKVFEKTAIRLVEFKDDLERVRKRTPVGNSLQCLYPFT